MASRCLINGLQNGSILMSKEFHQMNRKSFGHSSSNKSSKHMEQTYVWTDKQHEQWVDRKFGQLDQMMIEKKKSSSRGNSDKQMNGKSN